MQARQHLQTVSSACRTSGDRVGKCLQTRVGHGLRTRFYEKDGPSPWFRKRRNRRAAAEPGDQFPRGKLLCCPATAVICANPDPTQHICLQTCFFHSCRSVPSCLALSPAPKPSLEKTTRSNFKRTGGWASTVSTKVSDDSERRGSPTAPGQGATPKNPTAEPTKEGPLQTGSATSDPFRKITFRLTGNYARDLCHQHAEQNDLR